MTRKVVAAFATDHKYRYFTGVALYTLIGHSSPETRYEILILADSLSAADGAIFTRLIAGRENFSLRIVEMREKITELEHAGRYTETYPVTVCYRLFLHELLPQYGRVLYLDSDIVVQADVRELFETDLGGAPIGAVKDRAATRLEQFAYIMNTLGIKRPDKYFNSGVLMMDLNSLRNSDFSRLVRREIGSGFPFKFPDQDILNRAFCDEVHYLDAAWNHMIRTEKNIGKKKIIHFSGVRPWFSSTNPLAELWWSAAEKTPFLREMKEEISHSPGKMKYLEDKERAYYELLHSKCWRVTAGLRMLFNVTRWSGIVLAGIVRKRRS